MDSPFGDEAAIHTVVPTAGKVTLFTDPRVWCSYTTWTKPGPYYTSLLDQLKDTIQTKHPNQMPFHQNSTLRNASTYTVFSGFNTQRFPSFTKPEEVARWTKISLK